MITDYDPGTPIVPDAPGVPAVNRVPGSTPDGAVLQSSDGIKVAASADMGWGIYLASDNTLALEPDSFISFDYDAEYRISDFPLQDGQFETYNKVAMPFETRVIVSKGGSKLDRRDFIAAVEALRGDTELYNVVTPERTYLNVNFSRVSMSRKRDQGGGLVTYELVLREIRNDVVEVLTKEPSGAATKNNGTTRAQPADASTQAIVDSKAQVTNANGEAVRTFLSAGETLQEIATVAGQASQLLALPVSTAVAAIVLTQKSSGLYADVLLAGVVIAAGVLARDGVPLIGNAYSGFPGDLAIFDTQGNDDPVYTGLGDRFKLLWAKA